MTQHKDIRLEGASISRRALIGGAAAVGGAAAFSAAPWDRVFAEVEQMKADGWEAHPCACNVCGGYCGLLAMHKKGTAASQETIRIMPNPSHPQRGYCARGASAMYAWNHPLRLRKPLKRVGERGEGRFEEVSWDEALDGIASKIKQIVAEHGEKAVVLTSHNFTKFQTWFSGALGTPNVINHSASCNSGSTAGHRMVFGRGFDGVSAVEPDYENARYLLLVGRTLNCAMGVNAVVQKARAEGRTKCVYVDPRMPEGALGGDEWIAIKPGTDAAFMLGLINVGCAEGLVDLEFIRRWTNAPYLVEADGSPIPASKAKGFEGVDGWLAMDRSSGRVVRVGVEKNEKGANVRIVQPDGFDPDLDFSGRIELASGGFVEACTVYSVFMKTVAKYTPQETAKITSVPADVIVRVAREFFTLGGVCDDGWYSARNGNDTECFALFCLINAFAGNIDKKGGLIFTQGAGFGGVSAGPGKGPKGQKWKVEGKPIDKIDYPEGIGTFWSVFDAIHNGNPYPVKALFVTGSAMFHREANCERLAEALKGLELFVAQDIFPHEHIDYADYVLPTTFFLEWREYAGVSWARDGFVQKNHAGLNPPEGCDARHEIWQFCEILRRAFPERAAERLGYDRELKTREEYNKWFDGMMDDAWAGFIAKKNAAKPGEGDRIQAAVDKEGWALVNPKKFEVAPYTKPLGTATGKAELICFEYFGKGYDAKGLPSLPDYHPVVAYKQPKPLSDEFFLVSGKDSASSSGVALFTWPQKFLGDRTIWINPIDAERLGIANGDKIELEGLDNGVKGVSTARVTNRTSPGSLFSPSFNGDVRTRNMITDPRYEYLREGVNSNWFCTGYSQKVVGILANNASVRVRKL